MPFWTSLQRSFEVLEVLVSFSKMRKSEYNWPKVMKVGGEGGEFLSKWTVGSTV
jgi:hypothetical protein